MGCNLQPDSQSEHQDSEERRLFGPLEFLLVHAQSTRLDSTRNSYSGELVKEGAVARRPPVEESLTAQGGLEGQCQLVLQLHLGVVGLEPPTYEAYVLMVPVAVKL
jgi:hypothetical protein